MADDGIDKVLMSHQDDVEPLQDANMEPASPNNQITSSETPAESDLDVVIMDEDPADLTVSVRSEVVSMDQSTAVSNTSHCTSSDDQQSAENLSIDKPGSSQADCEKDVCDTSSTAVQNRTTANDEYHSDNESEIIVDDSPATGETVDSSPRNVIVSDQNGDQICENKDEEISVRFHGRSRSVTPSPSYIRLATPSTPGTPRLRSGSVSGTTFAPLSPKPSPSARATPGERQRAGSMGEIEMRDRMLGREIRHGVRIIDNLDILQLPRPRNPGGILPESERSVFNGSNEALNLSLDDRQHSKTHAGNNNSVSSSFEPILPSSLLSVSSSSAKQGNTSYLISNIIRSTPNTSNRLRNLNNVTSSSFGSATAHGRGCAINESVERPLPSSVVDSEGVAKKIARLNSEGFLASSTGDTLWNTTGSGDRRDDHLSRVRVISDKTPPERPKPPRRTTLSPANNDTMDISQQRSFVSSSGRRRLSPAHTVSATNRETPTNGADRDNMNIDDEICSLSHHYKCRICNYSSTSYNMLQVHSTKHGGSSKTFRCSMCDYSTHEKSNFRRHRKLHHKTSPVNVLKCVKCAFMTSISRKLRDHYEQAHADMPDLTKCAVTPAVSQSGITPQRYSGNHGVMPSETSSVYPGPFYDNSLLLNCADRLGYPYSVPGRQPHLNYTVDQYGMPYSNTYRDRHGESLASNYLRSIVSSIMNSESSRQAATSTVSSSNYYTTSGMDNSHPIQDIHTCNSRGPCQHRNSTDPHGIKIKVETEIDSISEGPNLPQFGSQASPDITRHLSGTHPNQISETANSNSNTCTNGSANMGMHLSPVARYRNDENLMLTNGNSDLPTDLSQRHKNGEISHPIASSARMLHVPFDHENGNDLHINHGHSLSSPCPSSTIIKTDNTSRAVQCILPVVKTDTDNERNYHRFCGRPCFQGVDRAVQCNMNNSSATNNSRSQCQTNRISLRSQSMSESDASEHHSSVCGESRCNFCGISFEDEVLFSIHIGCHSHTDPYKCNVCGKQCGNKYGFYSHIMRGHQM